MKIFFIFLLSYVDYNCISFTDMCMFNKNEFNGKVCFSGAKRSSNLALTLYTDTVMQGLLILVVRHF